MCHCSPDDWPTSLGLLFGCTAPNLGGVRPLAARNRIQGTGWPFRTAFEKTRSWSADWIPRSIRLSTCAFVGAVTKMHARGGLSVAPPPFPASVYRIWRLGIRDAWVEVPLLPHHCLDASHQGLRLPCAGPPHPWRRQQHPHPDIAGQPRLGRGSGYDAPQGDAGSAGPRQGGC